MRPQHAPRTPPAGNRKARRMARKRGREPLERPASGAAGGAPPAAAALALATEHIRAQRFDEAEALLRGLLAGNRDMPLAHNLLAQLLDRRKSSREAYHHHKQAVALAPDARPFWRDFGRCLRLLRQNEAEVVAFERAAALSPGDAACQRELAKSHFNAGNLAASIAALDRAIALQPAGAAAHGEKGCKLQFAGDFAGARASFEQALRLDPGSLVARFHLLQMGEPGDDPDALAAQFEAAAASPDVPPLQRSLYLFGLAKLHERRKDHDAAFGFYAAANDTLKALSRFDRDGCRGLVEETVAGFGPETFHRLRDAGSASDLPVFIVGMPRSGTTLVEQIISSHPQAFAGGEIRKMAQLAAELTGWRDEAFRYPRDAAALDPKRLSRIGEHYLSHLRGLAPPDALRATDKLPNNLFHVGLIAVLFPKAAIIHCRRDPMDTCLSCFFQCFGEQSIAKMTNDLADLGFLHRQHERLMEHWRAVLPVPVLEVRYEELVENQEAVSRRLLAFVGLGWDEACLRFYENERGVMTASKSQVRRPIYRSSLGRWRRYEKHLGPLRQALGGAA